MPAAQGGLARLPLRVFFYLRLSMVGARAAQLALICASCTKKEWFAVDVEGSTVLAASRADLDTAARGAGQAWSTANQVIPHA
jgi:hypothetical protein